MAHPQAASQDDLKAASLNAASSNAASSNAASLNADVRRLLSEALGRTVGDAENPSRETEIGWDSFTHVEIVFLLEDHFQVRFEGREIARLYDAQQIVSLLEARLAA